MKRARVGVLALQGDFALHFRALEALGVEPVRVSLPEHTEALAAMVLPGGESSTMLRLLESTGLRAPLEAFVREKPVLGTCAGAILLSSQCERLPLPPLGVLDVTTARNAFGRQIHSFAGRVHVAPLGLDVHGVFIRAPRFVRLGPGVEVVATWAGAGAAPEAVGVRQGRVVGLTFHPELTNDVRLHRWFLSDVACLDLPVLDAAAPASAGEVEPR